MVPYLLSIIFVLTPYILPALSSPSVSFFSSSASSSLTLPRSSRHAFCKNAPNVIAGTYFNPRSTISNPRSLISNPRSPISNDAHNPRSATPPMLWCAPHGKTSVLITIEVFIVDHAAVSTFLTSAYNAVLTEIQHYGDGLVQSGAFSFSNPPPAAGSGATQSSGAGASTSAAGAGESAGSSAGTAAGPAPLELHAWNENNHQMSWGVLGAAIEAIQDCMLNIEEWGTATFSIRDGDTEVGGGVLGHLGGN